MTTRLSVRRHRLTRSIGVLLSVGALLLAWCGTSGATHERDSASRANGNIHVVTTTPAPKGDLSAITWDLPLGQPLSIDAVKAVSYSTAFIDENMCTDLLRYSPNWRSLRPSLAQSWKYTDPTTLVFTIRQGIRFWNGQLLTSADVAYSLLRQMTAKQQPAHLTYFAYVKSVTVTGPYQVTVRFTKPDELFVKQMATVAGAISEKSYTEAKGSAYGTPSGGVMCTGPYELTKWNTGSDLVLRANPSFWTPGYRPKIASIKVKFITTAAALTSALLLGEITGAYEVPAASFHELKAAPDGQMYFGPSFDVTGIGPMTPSGPTAKYPKLREALSLAITRTALADVIYDGAAVPLNALTPLTALTGTPSEKSIYENAYAELPTLKKKDLAKARGLVRSVPTSARNVTLISLAGTENQVELATAVQQAAQSVGIKLKIDEAQTTTYLDALFNPQYQKGINFFQGGGAFTTPDPVQYYAQFVGKTAEYNWAHLVNPAVTKDVAMAVGTFTNGERARLFAKAEAGFMKVASYIPLLNEDEALFLNRKITGAPASMAYLMEPSLAKIGARK